MATIRPFRGLRFSNSSESLESRVAPPYDVLSQQERDELAAKSAHNIVHLTLPEQNADDRSKFVKYARSAAKLEEWRRSGELVLEDKPAFYRYAQTFTIPGTNESFDRLALITTIKVVPYDKGVVLPHEQTFPKHKEDRLRILEATRSHLECIYGLFEDEDSCIFELIREAPATNVANVRTDDGVAHKVDRIDDEITIAKLVGYVAPKKVWIADGHHRYETACTFRANRGEADSEIAEDYMMMAISSMSDPGLVLLPTHRMLKKLPFDEQELRQKLSTKFNIVEMPNDKLMSAVESKANNDISAFGVALPGGLGLLLTANRSDVAISDPAKGESGRLQRLDVSILHELIFERLLGIQGLDSVAYTRDPEEAFKSVENGFSAAFLMAPPSVDDMREIALNGEKMPQKSTYYYPKILSGLVLYSLNDWTP